MFSADSKVGESKCCIYGGVRLLLRRWAWFLGKEDKRQEVSSTIKQFARLQVRQKVAMDSQIEEMMCYVNI